MEFHLRTSQKYQVIDITSQVAEAVRNADVAEGICCVYVPHATAAVIISRSRKAD